MKQMCACALDTEHEQSVCVYARVPLKLYFNFECYMVRICAIFHSFRRIQFVSLWFVIHSVYLSRFNVDEHEKERILMWIINDRLMKTTKSAVSMGNNNNNKCVRTQGTRIRTKEEEEKTQK